MLTRWLCVGCICCGELALGSFAYAGQCYGDVQTAYQVLLADEQAQKNYRINLNTASMGDLVTLQGVGANIAAEIIRYRETRGGFHSVDELLNIKGIGQKTLQANRYRLTVQD